MKHHAFVYGTLGSAVNCLRFPDEVFKGEAITHERFCMKEMGFPVIFRPEDHPDVPTPYDPCPVLGEVLLVDDEQLARMDRLEGHPHFYKRETVLLAEADEFLLPIDAHIYVGRESVRAHTPFVYPNSLGLLKWSR